MSSQALLRTIAGLTGLNLALAGYATYISTILLERNHEEAEARMDELEGTLRGHIGLIEDSLERIEGVLAQKPSDGGGWGKGMSKKAEELYGKRGRDEKGEKKG